MARQRENANKMTLDRKVNPHDEKVDARWMKEIQANTRPEGVRWDRIGDTHRSETDD